jgi:hypothetical protein
VLPAARRDRPIGCFGFRSCGKGVFFRFCRWPGHDAVGWEDFAGRRGEAFVSAGAASDPN